MSLTGAMNSAVSAMQAQSSALSMISNNLANVSTTGYKASTTSFSSLLTSSSATSSSGGVKATKSQNILDPGTLVSSSVSTNLGIDGDGFFAVQSDNSSQVYYTRNGSFTVEDDTGYLTNNGYSLLGWPTDSSGNVVGGTTDANLEKIDTDKLSGYAVATSEVDLKGILPADASSSTNYTSTISLYDSLGTEYSVDVTWNKSSSTANTWTMSAGALKDSKGNAVTPAPTVSCSATITFNSDGTLASTSPASATTLTVTGLTDGASNISATINYGTAGSSDGLSQGTTSTGSDSTAVDVKCTSDGCAYGTLTGVSIDDDGTVYGDYSNNQSIAIYKIPLATFSNANGLTEQSSSVYSTSGTTSTATYHYANSDGVGKIKSSELENSTTDTNTEFSSMIAAQQAYSSASQIISTAKSMFETLLQAVR